MKQIKAAFLAAAITLGAIPACATTTTSNAVSVALSAQIVTSLALVVATPAVAFGVVTPGASNAAPLGQAVSVVSSWSLASGNTVKLYAYFDTAASAMTGTVTGSLIPTSAFTGAVNGGAAQAFTATNPYNSSATGLLLYSQTLTALTAISGRTDSLALTLNLTGLTSLAADNYTGTMYVQAQAM